jgi:hypothetical protein
LNALAEGSGIFGRLRYTLGLLVFYAVLYVVACVPIFAVADLPLNDALNHAARVYILNHLADEPVLQKYYTVHWDLFSFQSTDLLLPLLARWFGLQAAMHLFAAAAFALLIAGTVAVHRVLFGRVGLWPAAAFLFLYNFPMISGQISFLFSTGLSLLLFAAWLATEGWPRAIRIAVFAGASFGLMLCHFFAFCAYGLLVMCLALARAGQAATWGQRVQGLAEAGLPFLPAAGCFLLSFGQTIHGPTSYGKLVEKTVALLVGTINYGHWPDFLLTFAIIAAVWWLNRRKPIAIAADMRLPLLVLVGAAIAMPSLLRGVFASDLRLPCLLYFLVVAASEIRLEGRRFAVAFAAGIFALLLLRVGTTIVLWSQFEAGYREFRAADQTLERGSRVVVTPAPSWNISCFAVIDRQVFLPVLATTATPLAFTGEAKDLYSDTLARDRLVHWRATSPAFAAADPETVRQVEQLGQRISKEDGFSSTIDWSDWPERFDYLIDFNSDNPANPVPALLTEVRRGSYFAIYRIHPPVPSQP